MSLLCVETYHCVSVGTALRPLLDLKVLSPAMRLFTWHLHVIPSKPNRSLAHVCIPKYTSAYAYLTEESI